MTAYVRFNNAYIKLRASLFDKKALILHPKGALTHLGSAVGNYIKYCSFGIADRLPGPLNLGARQSQLGPTGTTRTTDWNKYHPARNEWPTPWSDAYEHKGRNRALVRLPVLSEKK